MSSVAEQLVEVLVAAGVQCIFGMVGEGLNAVTDKLRQRRDIRWVPLRHEEVAAFAAGAQAHLTGGLAVCAGSCGSGSVHLINGLYDCHRSRVPVLAIAGHIPCAEIGGGFSQETHPQLLFRDCSHYCELVSSPRQMPATAQIAIREALTKRGVSVIVLPGDVAMQEATQAEIKPRGLRCADPIVTPARQTLEELATFLGMGGRTTLLCGSGCEGAHDLLVKLAARLKAPIVHTLRGKEHVEWGNPYDVGMAGLIGLSSGYFAIRDCETLLMLGTNFPYRQFYPPPGTRIAQVDLRAENIGRHVSVDLPVIGDVRATLSGLLPLLAQRSDDEHLACAREHYARAVKSLEERAGATPERKTIHPQQVARLVSDLASIDAVFTCDAGLPTIWAARYVRMTELRRLIGSFWHGSLANALGQAIGAQLTFPFRQVVSLSGGVGLTMLMGDLLSLVQLKLPVKIVVFNNDSLGSAELGQMSCGDPSIGTKQESPSFAAIAQAAGIRSIRIEEPVHLEEGIRLGLAHEGPALIDVVVSHVEPVRAPALTAEMAKGLTLYMMRAVLNGRADEIIDLTRSKLGR